MLIDGQLTKACLKIIAWTLTILSVSFLFIVIPLLMTSFLMLGSGMSEIEVWFALAMFGFITMIIFFIGGMASFLAIKGLEEKKEWGYILGMIIAIMALPWLPLGTIIGALIIIGLVERKSDFNDKMPADNKKQKKPDVKFKITPVTKPKRKRKTKSKRK